MGEEERATLETSSLIDSRVKKSTYMMLFLHFAVRHPGGKRLISMADLGGISSCDTLACPFLLSISVSFLQMLKCTPQLLGIIQSVGGQRTT